MLKLKKSRGILIHALLAACTVLASYAPSAFARHGEGSILTNRIPEPAPYEYTETVGGGGGVQNPPFENLWLGDNHVGGCDGCHTGLWTQWNGSMMANAWRDPGWRGAFLLVARATSTDGCADTTPVLSPAGKAKDGSQGYDCAPDPVTGKLNSLNPFAVSVNSSTFKTDGADALYTGSGSLMDDFCSRCHMPTNYVDATIGVSKEGGPLGTTYEHGHISPTYDPTSVGTVTLADPIATFGTTREAFGTRTDNVVYSTIPGAPNATPNLAGTTGRAVNSNSGKSGIVCEVCHSNTASRHTPYHNYNKNTADYYAATKAVSRTDATQTDQFDNLLAPVDANGKPTAANHADMLNVPDANASNLGYAVGAGAFRLSPHALKMPERFGPLAQYFHADPANPTLTVLDPYVSDVFSPGNGSPYSFPVRIPQAREPGAHRTFYQAKFERAEFCASCHDVTNPMSIKNPAGKWVGGFPIERTYTEYLNSRYADRTQSGVLNKYYDANFKRDCQTCHMQQSFGQAGTALTLYKTTTAGVVTPYAYTDTSTGVAVDYPALKEPSCDSQIHNPGYSHHFVGGNAYVTKMIGADVDGAGTALPYPELLETSFSSKDKSSRFNYARFTKTGTATNAVATQHERFAWDRLRSALTMSLSAPVSVNNTTTQNVPISIEVVNAGAGHNFPTGFPEGRASWVSVRAFDIKNPLDLTDDVELKILDTGRLLSTSLDFPNPSLGVGYLTPKDLTDPTFAADCPDTTGAAVGWKIPGGSPDPYAHTFRAVATVDGRCPTLDLPYAYAVNLEVTATGVPRDASGNPVDRANPNRLPSYLDTGGYVNGIRTTAKNGDLFDDSFLKDTRLQPMRKLNAGVTADEVAGSKASFPSRYQVVVDPAVIGPITVTAAVYYQSFEAIVAQKFLGNLANLDDADTDVGFAEGFLDANNDGINDSPNNKPTLEPCVLKGPCDRIDALGNVVRHATDVRKALLFDPVVIEGAPPVPVIVKSTAIQVAKTLDTVAPYPIVNNFYDNTVRTQTATNMIAKVPKNRHWSPSPYGGRLGNFDSEGIGERAVDPARIVKITFSEPVRECGLVDNVYTCQALSPNTFYLATSRGVSVPALTAQIDDTTWALFPYSTPDQTFLSASTNVLHVAPSRAGWTIRDYSPVIAADGKAGNILKTGPTTTPAADAGQYTFGFKIM